ncbi:hybrid sensor histidine kinase/response regulator [Arenibaculum pallidiluteum]|uniref:hybrid sensor histidine kinase/response regulator n=1 Tax=Arenibaculum pallidiluteum TaxID=2812559 RepID=UPI001A9566F0|nr:ATP-binding protein [Arenibaculum pallidiluteum]
MITSIIAPPLLFGAAAWRDYRQMMSGAEGQAQSTVNMLREHALRVLDTHVLALKQVDERTRGLDFDTIEADPDIHRFLAELSRDLGSPNTLWITDADGRTRASSLSHPAPSLDISDREYFQAQKERDAGSFVSVPYRRRGGDQGWAFGISRRRSTTGGFDGIVHVSIDTRFFSDFWRTAGPVAAHIVPLMRDDRELLVRYPSHVGERLRLAPDAPFPRAVAQAPDGHYTAVSNVDHIERINAYRRIDGYPLTISYSIETRALLGAWWRGMAPYGLLSLISWIALVTATLVALRHTRRAMAALDELHAEARRRDLAEAALRRTQRFEAMGQLTGGVAHDFNNLLQVIAGGLRLLSRSSAENMRGKVLESLQQAVLRGQGLTRHLLSFARRQALAPEVINLGAEIARLEPLLQQVLRGNITLGIELTSDAHVEVDVGELELALLNLVVNARDAIAGEGKVTISVQDPSFAEREANKQEPDDVAISVKDTGCGIPAELHDTVFEPFFTTKPEGKGSGLGLSQVYGFAQQAGGRVTIKSAPGLGTTVTILLPRAGEPPFRRPIPEEKEVIRPIRPLRILMVEDNPEVGAMTRSVLQRQGHHVELATNGRSALEILETGKRFDVVFSDIVMPEGVGGLDLARHVRLRWPSVAVILATGYSDQVQDAVAEAFQVLRKPYDYGELEQVLQTLTTPAVALPPS